MSAHDVASDLGPLVDSHCHLDFDDFASEREALLQRARVSGVRWFVTIGASDGAASAPRAVALAHAYDDVVATVGVHPHDASVVDASTVATIERLARDPRVVAVGEVGLDYHYDNSPRETQREVFRTFVRVARALKKPIVIHTREAAEDTLAILHEEGAREVGGVIHCFSEDTAFARAALDLDFDISLSGVVTFKKSEAIREAAKVVPSDRLLIETDAPFLAPIPYRGKRNEPAYVAATAKFVAGLLGEHERDLRARTSANAIRRFGLDRVPSRDSTANARPL